MNKFLAALKPDMHKVYMNSSPYYRATVERYGQTLSPIQQAVIAQQHMTSPHLVMEDSAGYVRNEPVKTLDFIMALGY